MESPAAVVPQVPVPYSWMKWMSKRNPNLKGQVLLRKEHLAPHRAHLKGIFDIFDVDGSGFITVEELQEALENYGMPAKSVSSMLDMFLALESVQDDHEISFEEFVQVLATAGASEELFYFLKDQQNSAADESTKKFAEFATNYHRYLAHRRINEQRDYSAFTELFNSTYNLPGSFDTNKTTSQKNKLPSLRRRRQNVTFSKEQKKRPGMKHRRRRGKLSRRIGATGFLRTTANHREMPLRRAVRNEIRSKRKARHEAASIIGTECSFRGRMKLLGMDRSRNLLRGKIPTWMHPERQMLPKLPQYKVVRSTDTRTVAVVGLRSPKSKILGPSAISSYSLPNIPLKAINAGVRLPKF